MHGWVVLYVMFAAKNPWIGSSFHDQDWKFLGSSPTFHHEMSDLTGQSRKLSTLERLVNHRLSAVVDPSRDLYPEGRGARVTLIDPWYIHGVVSHAFLIPRVQPLKDQLRLCSGTSTSLQACDIIFSLIACRRNEPHDLSQRTHTELNDSL